jgi:hypothetical protein
VKLLLDQNFPSPIVDLSSVDASVEVVSLDSFDRELTKPRTPDWLIYLRAAEGGFDAVVTRDRSQLDEAEEMVSLVDSGMNVVTWRHAIEDPIQEWGQLLAYMPLVRNKLEDETSTVLLLPKPSLSKDQVLKAHALAGEIAANRMVAFAELRTEARTNMKTDLTARGLSHLAAMLGD